MNRKQYDQYEKLLFQTANGTLASLEPNMLVLTKLTKT